MPRTRNRLLVAAAGAALAATLASSASAQLVVATGSRQDASKIVDMDTMFLDTSYPIPINNALSYDLPNTTNASVWAMTAHNATQNLYYLDIGPPPGGGEVSANIYRYGFNTMVPQFVGSVRERNTGFGISMQGIAVDETTGKFYGVYNVGGTPGKGIYELTFPATPGIIWADMRLPFTSLPTPDTDWDMRSLEWDPATGKLHGINDRNTGLGGRGLYQFDLDSGTATFLQASPTYRRANERFDGLAFDESGTSYWVTRDPGVVYIWDPAVGQWNDFLSPIQMSGTFGGAAWAPGLLAGITAPEPTAMLGALGLGLLGLQRRRRA